MSRSFVRKTSYILLLGITLSIILNPSVAAPIDSSDEDVNFPLISVRKWVNTTSVKPGEAIHVTVNVTNWGNVAALNLTIEEPFYEDWAFSTSDVSIYHFVYLNSSSSFVYNYSIIPLVEGNFTIERTTVTYHFNSSVHTSIAQEIDVFVAKTIIIEDQAADWRNIWLWVLALALLPIILYFVSKHYLLKK
ncbi:MAG: hypothetical protein KAR35_01370 [Candidatus Heimdallarchaeota archaeon]|nr:hypothetical protein [Candidatus Heimdallarchaeota archaeon]MCK5048005.1 hypothetical protein [Candidatus Heimdallarchaeota archaeon]